MVTKITSPITGYQVVKPHQDVSDQRYIDDADRRIRISEVPTPTVASLRWAGRPQLPDGNDARIYQVNGPRYKFCVAVSHVKNGHAEPFEAWVLGEAPRGLSAIAKSLSMDMRSRDRGFLKVKLDSLAKVKHEPFAMEFPDGNTYRMHSEVAAFARLISWRCQELDVFNEDGDTPLLDALMSRKEPKTTTEGAEAIFWDVTNPATGDDFPLFLKEVTLPNGQRRPFSIWLSGQYPASLDGLCKVLSYDLRVVEPDWGIRKLKQLLDVEEPRGAFMAQVPGSEKRSWYPSTVAYMASLLLHRLQALGLGKTEQSSGVIALPVEDAKTGQVTAPKGLACEECGAYAVRMDGGCSTCQVCGYSHCS